jgi:hypothetical protein
MSAYYSQVLADRSMGEKLLDEGVAASGSFGEEQGAGGKTIDAMDDQDALSLGFELGTQKRQSGWNIGAGDGHGDETWRLVHNDDGIVLVEDGGFTGKP